jgi:hypothetical protein
LALVPVTTVEFDRQAETLTALVNAQVAEIIHYLEASALAIVFIAPSQPR